jgi:site-specific DNA-methyltransferase (adenine-specific)
MSDRAMTKHDSALNPDLGVDQIHLGDNLDVLRRCVPDQSVDLVYLDPPFNTARDFGADLRKNLRTRTRQPDRMFTDAWEWDEAAERSWRETVEAGGPASGCMQGFRLMLGETSTLAYLSMMAARLVELRRVLKPTASIYLHCDPGASHGLKLLMDAVFDPANFRNEIVWRYRRWPHRARRFQRMHDVLLFYSRSDSLERTFNTLHGYETLSQSTLAAFGSRRQVADFSSGRRKPATVEQQSPGPPLSDVWEVGLIAPIANERNGYPTQKPEALLERVILASSDEGQVVLDPFCGSGTTLAVAHRLRRRWIGIDSSQTAVDLCRARLERMLGCEIEVVGAPAQRGGPRSAVGRQPPARTSRPRDARSAQIEIRFPAGGRGTR